MCVKSDEELQPRDMNIHRVKTKEYQSVDAALCGVCDTRKFKGVNKIKGLILDISLNNVGSYFPE